MRPSHRRTEPAANERRGLDTLYGINAVKEALGSRPIDHLLVAEGHRSPRVEEIIELARARGVPVRRHRVVDQHVGQIERKP